MMLAACEHSPSDAAGLVAGELGVEPAKAARGAAGQHAAALLPDGRVLTGHRETRHDFRTDPRIIENRAGRGNRRRESS